MAVGNDWKVSKKTLTKFFGFDDFRSLEQEPAMQQIFKGNQDVYLNLDPNTGKALCFQLPTVLKPHAVSVVFVPTDILAKDQISFLKKNHIEAQYLCARTGKNGFESMMSHYQSNKNSKMENQFLYVLVHKQSSIILKELIIELKKKNALSYIVFDEAHSISPLSHDYMPAYQDLANIVKDTCPDVCKIAITATATSEVRTDLIRKLDIKNQHNIRSSLNKEPTVYHDVRFVEMIDEPVENLIRFVRRVLNPPQQLLPQSHPGVGIIFCRRKHVIKRLVKKLVSAQIPAVAYNGDSSLIKRESIYKEWCDGKIDVIVTTHTFGIGLHKSNVRMVVHWNLPLSMEQLYQETERISSNDGTGCCRVYYSCKEEENITTYIKSQSKKLDEQFDVVRHKLQLFNDVVDYCLRKTCRHVARNDYFNRIVERCEEFCDACRNPKRLRRRVTEFLEYRASMKAEIVDNLAWNETDLVIHSAKTNHARTDNEKGNATTADRGQSKRNRSRNRLFVELMQNYTNIYKKEEKNIQASHVAETAARLEYSLLTSGFSFRKYDHDVAQTILKIKNCTQSGTVCGYLKYFEVQEIPTFDAEPIVVDLTEIENDDVVAEKKSIIDGSVMVVDPVASTTEVPELITLSSDSSGSETE